MRTLAFAFFLLLAFGAQAQRLAFDTPSTTSAGNKFIAPAGWSVETKGSLIVLQAPEPGSRVVLMDIAAPSADAALAQAWSAYKPDMHWPLKVASDAADKDGWTGMRNYEYITSPDEKRDVWATARFANGLWTVLIHDMTEAVAQKRLSQVFLMARQLLPKGYERESFAGKKPHKLDAARIAELGRYVRSAQQQLGVPGVSIGLIQDGSVVFAGGFGVRELGKTAKVNADTKYMVASNTKALTTLMLGKLVEERKLAWDTAAVNALPSFRLGAADTTSRVLVKHLICACTGMPRQDLEWIFEFAKATPASSIAMLGNMQPTSKFGELFQYSNLMAAAAGYVAGATISPKAELGAAYDDAMKKRIFAPLGMSHSSFSQPLQPNLLAGMSSGYLRASRPTQPYEFVGPAPAGSLVVLVAGGKIVARARPYCDVATASCVAGERDIPDGRVVVASCVAQQRIKTCGRVLVADGVAKERTSTGGRVVAAGCVAKERLKTIGRVVVAGCVAKERTKTVGRVVVARCVAKECICTVGRVAEAGCVATKRKKSLSGVVKTGCVDYERTRTDGGVACTGCVAIERRITGGRVAVAACIGIERINTVSRKQFRQLSPLHFHHLRNNLDRELQTFFSFQPA
jgi:CubicO group peptidase (beta-lactamase class C family)